MAPEASYRLLVMNHQNLRFRRLKGANKMCMYNLSRRCDGYNPSESISWCSAPEAIDCLVFELSV